MRSTTDVDPAVSDLDSLVPDLPWLGVVIAHMQASRVVRANDAFLGIIGRERADIERGIDLKAITQPATVQTTQSALDEVRSTGTVTPFEKVYLRKDGTSRNVWITGTVVPGWPDHFLAYVLDITERHRAVMALRESEERARRFAEASFEGLFIHDHGTIVDCNDVIAAMFRTTREQLIGRSVFDFAHPSSHSVGKERIGRQYELPFEMLALRPDGSTFCAEILGKPLPVDGRVLRVTALRDLTERKRTEAALRDAEVALREAQKLESLGVMAGGIAHDFNNLLAIITGFAAVARRAASDGGSPLPALAEIEKATERAAVLTRQMLVYSGRSPRTIGRIEMNELVSSMAELASASFSKKIALGVSLDPALASIAADRAQMQQLVLNLLTNAAEAIGDAVGTISVRTEAVTIGEGQVASSVPGKHVAAGRYVRLEVEDSGCGMSEEVLARIFEPFFSTKGTGRGLGLAAMLGILRGHRAGLAITSKVGEGTRFSVYLPADLDASQLEDEEPRVSPSAPPPAGAVILVVDDEAALRQATRELLVADGHRVLEACDGVEAIDVLSRHAPEVALVILDVHMPRMGGREALAELRVLDPNVPILLTSGYDAHEALEGLGELGVEFLPKPSSVDALRAAVERALSHGKQAGA